MNCPDCKEKRCIDTTCKACFPKTNIPLNVIPGMTITVESDGLASINGDKLKAGVKYYPKDGDILTSHQDIHADEKIDIDSGQFHVINRPITRDFTDTKASEWPVYNELFGGDQ